MNDFSCGAAGTLCCSKSLLRNVCNCNWSGLQHFIYVLCWVCVPFTGSLLGCSQSTKIISCMCAWYQTHLSPLYLNHNQKCTTIKTAYVPKVMNKIKQNQTNKQAKKQQMHKIKSGYRLTQTKNITML